MALQVIEKNLLKVLYEIISKWIYKFYPVKPRVEEWYFLG